MKGNDARDSISIDYWRMQRGSGFDNRRTARESPEAQDATRSGRPLSIGDHAAVAQLRAAISGSPKDGKWGDYAIAAGAAILAGCIVVTLILATHIDARANRLIDNDARRAQAGGVLVERIEGKIDGIDRKLTEHAATTTTTRPSPRSAPIVRSTPTVTTRPTTTLPTTTTTTEPPLPAATPTSRPCLLPFLGCIL